jgi:hypothetical protein
MRLREKLTKADPLYLVQAEHRAKARSSSPPEGYVQEVAWDEHRYLALGR